MSQTTNVADRIETVRQQTLATLRTLTEKGKAFGLPEPPAALEQYRHKLEANTYQVLVVGEAKRGKSTFVNALIGRDILPTDVDIATSQVFRICPADKEAYRLCFEDDSVQAITAADLPRYGSQVMADAVGVPRLDQIIRWIEVDAPVKFLPRNVRILDTPGLGALYAAHAEITHRFVPHADAVIFVLDSQAPIGEPEIKFVEKLLGATNHVFFIQTKIDQFRKEAWQEIQKRNEDILRQRFRDRLADTRVWPISSTNLRKAAETGDDDYLIVSRHKELASALQAFLFRVAGWSRSANATLLAEHTHSQSSSVLMARLHALTDESRQKRADIQERASDRRKRFDADWGERGAKRRELLQQTQKLAAIGRQQMRQVLQPGGEIENAYQAEIEKLDSISKVDSYAKALPGRIVEAALDHWRQVQQRAQAECAELVKPLIDSLDSVIGEVSEGCFRPVIAPAEMQSADGIDGWFAKARNAMSYETVGLTVAGGWAVVLVSAGILTWPVAMPIAGVVGAASWFLGWRSAQQTQLKGGKQELARHLANILRQIQKQFFDVNHASNRFSVVDEYFNSLDQTLADQIGKLTTQKLAEAQAEINRLTEDANLDDQQRKAKADDVRRQLAEWDAIGQGIQGIRNALQELDRSNTAASHA